MEAITGNNSDLIQGIEKSCSISVKGCPDKPSTARPPDRFSDPSTIVPPASLPELIAQLHEIFASDDVSVDYVKTLMASYKGNRAEWKRYAKFDPHRYTRNLVDEGNGKFNLMVLCWNEGQGSSIHSHANSHCFLKVLSGEIKEKMYEWPGNDNDNANFDESVQESLTQSNGKQEGQTTMKQVDEFSFGQNECTYINDSIGLHRVENNSHVDKAVTLHLYSPPFQKCQCFDERTGRATTSSMTFWSKHGKRTPFGRNPDKVPVPETVENN